MASLAGVLTAGEVVAVAKSAPRGAATPDDAYEYGLALMALALLEANPARLVQAADQLLVVADGDVASGAAQTVLTELAAVDLLLGKSERALAYLGFAEATETRQKNLMKRAAPAASVQDYVVTHAAGQDYLAGVCVLVEKWINETLLRRYPELQGSDFALLDWFEDPSVGPVLERGVRGVGGVVAATVGVGKDVVGSVTSAVNQGVHLGARAVADVGGVLAGLLPAPGAARAAPSLPADTLRGRTQGALVTSTTFVGGNGNGGSGLGSGSPRSPGAGSMYAYESGAPPTTVDENYVPTEDADAFSSLRSAEQQLRAYMASVYAGDVLAVGAQVAGVMVAVGALYGVASKLGAVPEVRPLGVLSRMVEAVESTTGSASSSSGSSSTGTTSTSGRSPYPVMQGPMTVALAERMVLQWQRVKAAALGGQHDVARLSSVLDGRMLTQWKDRAMDVKHKGWHWEYRVSRVAVDSVELSADGDRAVIEATVDESAQLIEGGQALDSYRSQYAAQYQMTRKRGVWKIVGGKIIYR